MQATARRRRDACRGTTAPLIVLALVTACAGVVDDGRSEPPSAPVIVPGPPRSPDPVPRPPTGDGRGVPAGLPAPDILLPPLELVEVAQLEAPTDTAVLADGTVLVAERRGIVRVLLGADPGRIVIDVSDRTTTQGERGLLSIAVTPSGDELLLSMTDERGDTLVEAHPLVGTRVGGAGRTIYTLPQPFANHNGGHILFLPDGTLLLGLGDGGGGGDPLGAGQDPTTPLGAIVRLDVSDGRTLIPDDNPFRGVAGAAPEVLAIGLRNPWRMHLDAARGELWIADVGQSNREEINRVTLDELWGANFGWALREGSLPYLGGAEPEGHVRPIHDYDHGPGCSVTGGVVYRGSALPALVGGYVFTDLCDGQLRLLVEDGGVVSSLGLGVSGERIVGLGTDADGEVLVLELGGRVLRLRAR
jgi:glucose/arabinose dehydrogenase